MDYPISTTRFTYGGQAGVNFYITPLAGIRLAGTLALTPGVPDNSAYFGDDKDGAGFPSFGVVGNPSSATLVQWSGSLGVVIHLGLGRSK